VTTSHLPRRAIVGAALAVSLVGGGLIAAFADDAPAGACPSWTDPAGDATTGQEPTGTFTDDQMDIISASLANDGANVVATIGDVKLGDTASDFGDEFHINFTIGGKELQAYADRGGSAGDPLTSPVGFGAGFTSITDGTSGEATAKYDTKANTVTITGTVAELSKALGSDATGKVATAIVAETQDYIPQVGGFVYDDAASKGTFTVGADCGGAGVAPVAVAPSASPDASASPSPSASPDASASPSPTASGAPAGGAPAAAGLPTAGCALAKDPKGDAQLSPVGGAPGLPNDPDLDVTSLTLGTDGKNLKAFVKVDALASGPMVTEGHRFYVSFTFNKHNFTMAGSSFKNGEEAIRDGASQTGQVAATTQLAVDGVSSAIDPERFTGAGPGFVDSGLKYTFDLKNSYAIASLPLTDLEKYGKAPAAGAVLTGVYASANADNFATALVVDSIPDGAGSTAPGKLTYNVGDNACFAAAASPLTSVGAVKAQYGDVAAVAAKLVDAAGAPLAGKTLTFALGASKATGVTAADGVAKAALTVTDKAGKRSLKVTGEGASTTVPFTVLVEKTALRVTGAKGTVAATLSDDDKKPVAGQPVTFTAGSKKATVKTDAKGVAKVAGFAPGTTVKVTYAGAAGMYSATAGSTKA
jgi:hypothetical protein